MAVYDGGFVLYNRLKEDLELISVDFEDENRLQFLMSPLRVFDGVILKSGNVLRHEESFDFLIPPPPSKQFIVRKVEIRVATDKEKLGELIWVVWRGSAFRTCNKSANSRKASIRLKRPLRGGCPPWPFEIYEVND